MSGTVRSHSGHELCAPITNRISLHPDRYPDTAQPTPASAVLPHEDRVTDADALRREMLLLDGRFAAGELSDALIHRWGGLMDAWRAGGGAAERLGPEPAPDVAGPGFETG
jgi:hypothetical protein